MGVLFKNPDFCKFAHQSGCYLKVFIGFIYYLHIVWYYIKPEYLTDFLYLPMTWVLFKNPDFCKFAHQSGCYLKVFIGFILFAHCVILLILTASSRFTVIIDLHYLLYVHWKDKLDL